MREVYCYNSIDNLRSFPWFGEISEMIHITEKKVMASGLSAYYNEFNKVVPIDSFIREFIPEWYSVSTSFEQFVNLSKVIRDFEVEPSEEKLKESFIKNKQQVLKAIRILVEANISPEEIEGINQEEKLFESIWWQTEEEDESFWNLRKRRDSLENGSTRLKKGLEALGITDKQKSIALHGFYSISPIQKRFFDILENNGFRLIFLACFDNKQPEVGDIWRKVFDSKLGYPDYEDWRHIDTDIDSVNQFSSIFKDDNRNCAGTHRDNVLNNLTLIRYDSEVEFVRDFERITRENQLVYSADHKAATNLLKEFYPEAFARKHMLSYPVGQYIYQLHRMWNANTNQLEISFECLQACFNSGWLVNGEENAQEYTHELEKLKTYVQDCLTVKDWQERIELLKTIGEDVFPILEEHIDKLCTDECERHRTMANPLRNFSCFSVSKEALDKVLGYIETLLELARHLFQVDESCNSNINDHLNRVKAIIREGNSNLLYDEERQLAAEILTRLNIKKLRIDKCNPGDIASAIMLSIGDGIVEDGDEEGDEEMELAMVRSHITLESHALMDRSKIHLCLADENNLPAKARVHPWPLTDELIDRLIAINNKYYSRYLYGLHCKAPYAIAESRYLFNTLIGANCDIEISWIANADDKSIEMSPYLKLLKNEYSVEVTTVNNEYEPFTKPIYEMKSNKIMYDFSKNIEETNMAVIACKWRYLYGYIVNKRPTYSSDFHYGFGISSLIKAITATADLSKETAARTVFELFPYLRDVEKQQIADYSDTHKRHEQTSVDNILYTTARLDVHFLMESEAKELRSKLIDKKGPDVREIKYDEPPNGKHCKYCPFKDDCRFFDRRLGK